MMRMISERVIQYTARYLSTEHSLAHELFQSAIPAVSRETDRLPGNRPECANPKRYNMTYCFLYFSDFPACYWYLFVSGCSAFTMFFIYIYRGIEAFIKSHSCLLLYMLSGRFLAKRLLVKMVLYHHRCFTCSFPANDSGEYLYTFGGDFDATFPV